MFINGPDCEVYLGTRNAQDSELPLHKVVLYRSIDTVKWRLRQKGLNLDIQDWKGYTPLYLAV